MHSKLKKLAEQAVVEVKNLDGTEYVFSKEKFAELIVEECAGMVDSYVAMKVDPNMLGPLIKMSFGVD